ncbi:DUF2235 domain-containing protein [Rhodovulum sp. ES.010]|uniref:DUF2235 domain-containing protein n=1 Tax=Rhodovulum sp. ES.010 TaxID=1882821 RepID=UPI00352F3298
MRLADRISHWLRRPKDGAANARRPARGPTDHVILLDGTLGSLAPGELTHVGRTYRLLCDLPASAPVTLYYEAGIQWPDWRRTHHVAAGRGINRQIRRAYGYLASRYRPGDRIFLIGHSRGAYAVRSLAGIIGSVGLLRAEHAVERNVMEAYRHYESATDSPGRAAFTRAVCHAHCEIEMVGAWDTVKALGLRLPLFWMLTESRHAFHDHRLGPAVRHGYHALALDERRVVFAPVLWESADDWAGHVEQVWFHGCHGDVGGQLGEFAPALPLAHIPLVWMLEKAAGHGLRLPEGWRARFPCDPAAPSVGMNRSWGKLFVLRRDRPVGRDPSEALHPTALAFAPEAPLPLSAPAGLTPQG